jgi:hypothetical protein
MAIEGWHVAIEVQTENSKFENNLWYIDNYRTVISHPFSTIETPSTLSRRAAVKYS